MEWLSQNWIWLALGIGALFMISRRGSGHYAGGHAGHAHGGASGPGTGDTRIRPAEPACDRERPGTAAVTNSASAATGAGATPAQGAPSAHRRHGCC